MEPSTRAELAQALRRQRAAVLKRFFDAEADLQSIAEDQESELEERAAEERAARVLAGLDDRSLSELGEVHAALQRLIDGTYGTCRECGGEIPLARLRALPTTPFCVDCARAAETRPAAPEAAEPRHPGRLPADLDPLLDREVEEALRELVRTDRRIDSDELRLVCRHGVVHLEGAIPSEAEHSMLRRLVTDVAGCEEIVDHVQVNELSWERADRTRPASERPPPARLEPTEPENVVDWTPPDVPPAEEE